MCTPRRPISVVRRESGFVSIFTLALLTLFLVTGIALFELHQSSSADSASMRGGNQARELAQSALQEAKWYTMTVNPEWTGTRPEQPITVGGTTIGSFDYTTSRTGNTYTVTANGYYPNKTHPSKVTHTLSSTFTFSSITVGILVLDGTKEGALSLSGNGTATIQGGRIVVNSNHAKAVTGIGNVTVKAPEVYIVGNYSLTGNSKLQDVIFAGAKATADPLAALPEPAAADYTVRSAKSLNVTKDATLEPGRYVGGVDISNNANVTLNPGIYYIDGGGFTVSGNANLNGSEVMIYNVPSKNVDDISFGGTGAVVLTAPTTGAYKDVVVFQQRAGTATATLTGNVGTSIGGSVYTAGAELRLSGNGVGASLGSRHVAKTVAISGDGSFTINTAPEE